MLRYDLLNDDVREFLAEDEIEEDEIEGMNARDVFQLICEVHDLDNEIACFLFDTAENLIAASKGPKPPADLL